MSGSSRGQSTSQGHGYSTAYGQVLDPQIIKVVVTWEDGHLQSGEVQEGTYFIVREGGFSIQKIEAYNEQHEIVYTNGKE